MVVALIGANGLSLETDRWGQHEDKAEDLKKAAEGYVTN